ncbi:Hha/YmoA family nucleoid-associated regulatory protein [Sodalis-like endosymbiont of Proechinophthirus fluctus]
MIEHMKDKLTTGKLVEFYGTIDHR